MQIPFLDLKRQYEEIEAEATAALSRVLTGGIYILGREVEAFEEEWTSFCGARAAAGVNSGTDALTLALLASGAVRPDRGDEVITSPLTAGYTALAIVNAGGVPVFADIDPHTYTLAPHAIKTAITPRTRAIVPIHLYGQMADMDAICEVAESYGLSVIEDGAQAHGARIGERRVGSFGQAAAFSFYPTKNLGAYGDAGAVTSQDGALIEKVKALRQGGHPGSLNADLVGQNSRLDEMQAALLRVKLKHLEAWNQRRQSLAAMYHHALGGTRLILPHASQPEAHVFHLYVVQHPQRESLRAHLAARGIETAIHYPFLLHQQSLFKSSSQRPLPVAKQVSDRIFSLPLHPHLSEAEVQAVIDAILEF